MKSASGAGKLYVVATPIGNLEDISPRALRVLREASFIACEDTRHSRKLLEPYGIHRPLLSYYRENEHQRADEIVARLLGGETAALISDAGAPMLSDPGAVVVGAAIAVGVDVIPIPGASAPIAALMAAGIAVEPVLLAGFLPARAGERRRQLAEWKTWPGTIVCLESPHRVLAAVEDLVATLGPARPLVAARELTKVHEEFLRGTAATVLARLRSQPVRGEFTLVLGPAPPEAPSPDVDALTAQLRALTAAADPKAELKRLARVTGIARSELYRRWQELKPG